MSSEPENDMETKSSPDVCDLDSHQSSASKADDLKHKAAGNTLNSGTFWLTRICFIRSLGFVYAVAFLVAYHQNGALLGHDGLLPADQFMGRVQEYVRGNRYDAFNYVPTLFWLFDWKSNIDILMHYTSLIGLTLSVIITMLGACNMIVFFVLWCLYHTIVNVGQRWYSFGWESQLLETGFLAIFFVPVFSMRRFPKHSPPSRCVVWGYRWLIFRIMIGAGLIKIRGDECWRDLTCMNYHYQTQPVPNPISYYLHQLPSWWHQTEVLGNHFVELIAPWAIFLGRYGNICNGVVQILFQVILIISGNLSFLNWLTILPSICSFDDKFVSFLFDKSTVERVCDLQRKPDTRKLGFYVRRAVDISLVFLIGYLSVPVVQNLVSSRQAMNTSFEPLRIVNTYGAFGSITKTRTEVILQGTYSNNPSSPSAEWLEYEFRCKPGNISRTPCIISPYHHRLDWLMWFAAFQRAESNPWFVHLVGKLLMNDNATSSLISHNPFQDQAPPLFVRAEHYKYVYTKIGSPDADRGEWYQRKRVATYYPPQSLDTILPIMKRQGWKIPKHLLKYQKTKKH